jgi:acylphosphatase
MQSIKFEGTMEKKRVRVWVEGRVQGVAFRFYTRDTAIREGVSGWVRNLADGRVEAVFEGEAESVDRVVSWCRRGSPGSHVDLVTAEEETPQGEPGGFRIRH